jgi:hypothetical protein
MIECSFLIPIVRDSTLSDGKEHSPELWRWLDAELLLRFGGRTVAPGHQEGFYRDPDTGNRVDDRSIKFTVALENEKIDQLRSLLRAACLFFGQKCIYLSVAGHVEFIESI